MKRFTIAFIFTLLIVLLVTDAEAQRRRRRYRPRRPGGLDLSSMLHTVNFGVGYYSPKMDFWNERSFLVERNKQFNSGLIYYGGVDLRVYEDFLIGIYGGTYSDQVKSTSIVGLIDREETLRYRITPISLVGKYEWSFWNPRMRFKNRFLGKIHPYAGAGVNFSMINFTLVRKFTDTEVDTGRDNERYVKTGSTITYSGIAGVKYDITDFIGVGVEMNYYLGSFNQGLINESNNEYTENVSITGPSFNAMVYYKFGGKYGSYNRRRARGR
ncbi:MAG: hypothetical protein ACFHWX_13395 [Bacteroidota bacterium]